MNKFNSDTKDIYLYFKSNATHLDTIYFVRNNEDFRVRLNKFCFESDPRFSTTYDYYFAKYIANGLLIKHFENELYKLKSGLIQNKYKAVNSLKWTSSKSNLIELIYAIQEVGCFNNGNADIKIIAANFSKMFDIPLGDIYRTYIDLRAINIPTKFLNSLINGLENRMLNDDM